MDNPRAGERGYRGFARHVDVNGFAVYGESGVNDEKLLYVAAIVMELLDNDEDGRWDDHLVVEKLLSADAVMPVFRNGGSNAEREFFAHYRGRGVRAVLYNGEIDPTSPGRWGSDATVEEVMHTVNAVGHAAVYPRAFGLEPASSVLTAAMDLARGGRFLSVPDSYPDDAWYHYDDRTCDYPCMAVEYLYWAQAGHLGLLEDPSTCRGIADEWELCTPGQVAERDPAIHAVLVDHVRPLPQRAPDGRYAPAGR